MAAYERAKTVEGGTFWVPTAGDTSAPRGVVFASPRGRAQTGAAEHPAFGVVTAAVETAVSRLRAETDQPVLIGLVAFRMRLGEDREDRLRSARAQVRAAYDAVGRHADVDVAFVCEDQTKYEIFLEARRAELAASGRERAAFDHPGLSALIDALRNEECVVFVGAGLSQNASLTGYADLIREMGEQAGLGAEFALDLDTSLDVAQCYRDQDADGTQLTELIGRHFGSGSRAVPSLAHYLAMSLPVRFIITTNYDRLLEQTLEALHRFPLRVIDENQVAQTGFRDGTFVVKFHGDAEAGGVIISRDDYDTFFRDRPEMASLLEGLLLNQTFFFLGYSLRDPNFRQIYSKIDLMLRAAKRPAFLTTVEPTPPATRRQYQNKQLKLVDLSVPVAPGDEPAKLRERADRGRRLCAFLDRLAEEVTRNSHLFLVPDAWATADPDASASAPAGSRAMKELYHTLRKAGWQLAEASQSPLTVDETRYAARILSFLAEQGWRPRNQGVSMTGLWQQLAKNLDGIPGASREKRQILISALRYADTNAAAERLQKHLTEVGE